MYRFFCSSQNISADKIIIHDRNQVHHLRDVLRLKTKDQLVIFDDKGKEYRCIIESFSPGAVRVKIKDKPKVMPSRLTKITVACAMPKKSKMDDIVDKLTQLGVDRIIPLLTERVIIKLDTDREASRHKRWQNIAISSSQQSQRGILPVIDSIKDLKAVLSESKDFDLKLIPTLTGQQKSLKEIMSKSKYRNILVFIGPEGDFSPHEIDLAKKSGCIPVSLGDSVLRVETAAIAVTSFIRLYENR